MEAAGVTRAALPAACRGTIERALHVREVVNDYYRG
jgi:hypothetical protein